MKKLFTSTLLAAAAVPFLMAAPNTAAKKVQNTATPAATASKKTQKKHVKKSHPKQAPATAAPSANQK